MEPTITKAMEDITSIKTTLQDSKIHFRGFYRLCFLLGFYHVFRFLLTLASVLSPAFVWIETILSPILTLTLCISYFFIFKSEKKYANKYYVSLLNTWGMIAFAIPDMTACITLKDPTSFNRLLFDIQSFSNVLLFSIFMIVCSYLLDRKYLRPLSMLILFLYLLLATSFSNSGIPLPLPMSEHAYLSSVRVFLFFVIDTGYILLGVWIQKRAKSWI